MTEATALMSFPLLKIVIFFILPPVVGKIVFPRKAAYAAT
jgi:hypothetical protein